MDKHCPSNLLSQGSIEQDYLWNNVKSFSFWGYLIKMSNSVLNFSTESAKPTIYDFVFLITLYSPKNHNNRIPRNWQSLYYITEFFPGWGPILMTGRKYWLTVNLQIFFLLTNYPMEIKVSHAQSIMRICIIFITKDT